jgi:ABC-2 type transport system permease protein
MATMTREMTGVGPHRAGLVSSTLVVARRAFLKFLRTPQLVVFGSIQMALFLVIFRYVFGGAIGTTAGVPYVDFLVPGFIASAGLFVGSGVSIGVAEDMEQGFIDRLRSLPIPRASVLLGRFLSDTAVLAWSLAIGVGVGFLAGFRLHGSPADGLAAFALCIVFGCAFGWLFMCAGMYAGNAQAAQAIGFLVFPLAFVSSAYVPAETLPGWLQVVAEHQPVTYMVDAVRALTMGPSAEVTLGHPTGYFVIRSLIWVGALVAVFAPLTIARFRRG